MYGWLSIDPDHDLVVTQFQLMPLDAPAASASRGQALIHVAQAFSGEADRAVRQAAGLRLGPALQLVGDTDVDYAARVGTAFFKRHRDSVDGLPRYEAELRRIDAVIDAEIGELAPGANALVVNALRNLKASAFLLHPAQLPYHVNQWCTTLRGRLMEQPGETELMPLRKALGWLIAIADTLQGDDRESVRNIGATALTSCRADEVLKMDTTIRKLVAAKRFKVFSAIGSYCERISQAEGVWQPYLHLAMRRGLSIALDERTRPVDQVAEAACEQAWALGRQADDAFQRDSIDAVDAGFDQGPQRTETSRAALAMFRAARAAHEQCQDRALVAKLRQHDAAAAQTPDTQTLQAWPLERLVRWIDGPAFGPRRKPLDRQRVNQRRREARPAAAAHEAQAAQQQPASDAEVTLIEQQGYGEAAQFFVGELRDMRALALALKAPAPLIEACAALVDPLTRLSAQPGDLAEAQAQLLLTQAEAAGEQLRAGIRAAQAAIALQDLFEARLRACVLAEDLTPGRRQGGAIGCALRPADWGWVVERFHRRWYPARHLVIDGQRVPLDADEAVAFYVTASSQSGHAFDISVHLWRRDAGKTSLPGLAGAAERDAFAPMNANDWFDTYVTCCVLHVPSA